MKILNKFLMLIIMIILFVISCAKNDKPIVFNLGSDYNTLDPHLFTEMIAVQIDTSIYEGLLILDKDGNYTGGMAKSYTENGNKLTFKIRDNAKWSDGSKITANDFVFAFKRVLDPKVAAQYSEMLFPIKNAEAYYEGKVSEKELGVKALDDKTLEIELEQPTAYFKYILTLPITVPLKEEFYKTRGDKFAIKQEDFLFNGPYVIKSLGEEEILLEKNKNYWNAKNIKIPSIKYIKSTDFRIVDNLIKNNEIDMSRVESYHLEEYKKENKIDSFLNGRVWYLEYNLENKNLQNLKIRKAISMAIDREKYVKEIKKDGSKVAKSLIGKDIDGFNKKYREIYPDDTYISNDIIEAKKLYNEGLNEIGKKELTLNLLSGNSDPEVLEVQFIQEELRTKLGINVNVQTVPFKERLNKTRAGEYDITLNTWSPKYNDVLSYLERWQNKNPKDVWSKDNYNELLKEIYKLNSSSERDLRANMAEKIIIDEVVVAPLYFAIENHYRNPKIKGVVRRPITGITDFRWAYID